MALKRVAFEWESGKITFMNEAVADIYEKRGKGKIIVDKKSFVIGNSKTGNAENKDNKKK